VPSHVLLQQRRRARINRERQQQLQKFHIVVAEGEEEGGKSWSKEDKKTLSLIGLFSIAILFIFCGWIGPRLELEHNKLERHDVHMHGFAGDVGGLCAVTSSTPHLKYVNKELDYDGSPVSLNVFDIKVSERSE